MGVRVEVREGETVQQAIRRFRKLVRRFGPPGAAGKQPKWHKRQLDHYVKPSELRRRAAFRAKLKTKRRCFGSSGRDRKDWPKAWVYWFP